MIKKVILIVCYNITFFFCCGPLFFTPLSSVWAHEPIKPVVVTTTKPMAIIAKSALGDNATVEFILPPGQSPHDAVITVSVLNKIAAADMVLWIGPSFEVRVAKHLLSIPKEKLLTGMEFIYQTESQNEQNIGSNNEIDPHIWLSPKIARRIASALQEALNMPERDIFTEKQFIAVANLLESAKDQYFISHHDSISYFVDAFSLQPPFTLRNGMGGKRGARSQLNLRSQALQFNARCVLVEPQQGYKDASRVAGDLQLPLVKFDVQAMGRDLKNINYADYMYSIAEQLKSCFQ